MLVKGQTGVVKIHPLSIQRYLDLGYDVSEGQKLLTVRAEHLPKSSPVTLKYACDECGDVFDRQKRNKKTKHDLCQRCQVEKASKFFRKVESEIRVYGGSKLECYKKVVNKEKQGYECCFPIQERERLNEYTNTIDVYYYTVMRLAE